MRLPSLKGAPSMLASAAAAGVMEVAVVVGRTGRLEELAEGIVVGGRAEYRSAALLGVAPRIIGDLDVLVPQFALVQIGGDIGPALPLIPAQQGHPAARTAVHAIRDSPEMLAEIRRSGRSEGVRLRPRMHTPCP